MPQIFNICSLLLDMIYHETIYVRNCLNYGE